MIAGKIQEIISHRIFAGAYYSLSGADKIDTDKVTDEILALLQEELEKIREKGQDKNISCPCYFQAIDDIKSMLTRVMG